MAYVGATAVDRRRITCSAGSAATLEVGATGTARRRRRRHARGPLRDGRPRPIRGRSSVEHGRRGIYNVVDDEPAPIAEWLPELAKAVGAKPPRRVPLWLARLAGGEVAAIMMSELRGQSNTKAKRELGWQFRWPTWREGFARGLG